MWHGGTNFAREAMYLQITSYDYTAPLDEYGLATTKYNHLARLHYILNDYAEALLIERHPAPQIIAEGQCAYTYSNGDQSITFLCNDSHETQSVLFDSEYYSLKARSVSITGDGQLLMNTAEVQDEDIVTSSMIEIENLLSSPVSIQEPFPQDWVQVLRSPVYVDTPVEQLRYTKDKTDYCWYTTQFTVEEAIEGQLKLHGVNDFVYILSMVNLLQQLKLLCSKIVRHLMMITSHKRFSCHSPKGNMNLQS